MKTRIFVHQNTMVLSLFALPLFSFAQKDLDLSFDGIKMVYMTPPKGDCEIRMSRNTQVKIELSTGYNGDKVPVYSIAQSGDSLKVQQKDHPGSVSGSTPKWILWIPNKTDVFYKTGNGGIDGKNLTANLTLETGEGNINISQSSGVFKIKTGRGDIAGTDISLMGASEFNMAKGNCRISFHTSLQEDMTISAGSGDITLDMKTWEMNAELTLQLGKKSKAVMPFELGEGKTFNEKGNNERWTEKSISLGSASHRILLRSGKGIIKLIK